MLETILNRNVQNIENPKEKASAQYIADLIKQDTSKYIKAFRLHEDAPPEVLARRLYSSVLEQINKLHTLATSICPGFHMFNFVAEEPPHNPLVYLGWASFEPMDLYGYKCLSKEKSKTKQNNNASYILEPTDDGMIIVAGYSKSKKIISV